MARITLVAALVTCLFAGCGGSGDSQDETAVTSAHSADADHMKAVRPSRDFNETSPTEMGFSGLDANSPPSMVCERFLQALKDGDQISAEQLLTKKALYETRLADLELEGGARPALLVTKRVAAGHQRVAEHGLSA